MLTVRTEYGSMAVAVSRRVPVCEHELQAFEASTMLNRTYHFVMLELPDISLSDRFTSGSHQGGR